MHHFWTSVKCNPSFSRLRILDHGIFGLKNENCNERTNQQGASKRLNDKKLLIEALCGAGVTFQQNQSYTKKELQDFARMHGVDLREQKEQIITRWLGQVKGLAISEALIDKYTLDGRKDPISGKINLQFSLRHLLAECTNFKDEEETTSLQFLGTQLGGMKVQLTLPKFHVEFAGEGVEQSWAHVKAYFHCAPISRKRTLRSWSRSAPVLSMFL